VVGGVSVATALSLPLGTLIGALTEDEDGRIWQAIEPPDRWQLAVVDVSAESDPQAAIAGWIRADLAGRINLHRGHCSAMPSSKRRLSISTDTRVTITSSPMASAVVSSHNWSPISTLPR
jgi:hypothetical protein